MDKDSPRITAGELQRLVEQPLYHHMLFGRVSRKILLSHPKTNSSIFSCQTRLDKKYPMSTVKYTAGSLMLWACFSAGGPGCLVQMASWIISNTNR